MERRKNNFDGTRTYMSSSILKASISSFLSSESAETFIVDDGEAGLSFVAGGGEGGFEDGGGGGAGAEDDVAGGLRGIGDG